MCLSVLFSVIDWKKKKFCWLHIYKKYVVSEKWSNWSLRIWECSSHFSVVHSSNCSLDSNFALLPVGLVPTTPMPFPSWSFTVTLSIVYFLSALNYTQSTPVFLPEKSQGQRSLAGYSWKHCKESDMTEQPSTHIITFFVLKVFL